MQIDIKAKELKPIRQTYSHVARRIGENKSATRYQEAIYDVQAVDNFHYRPTWQPEKELYDPDRTVIEMEDWYKFLDPRQYYYGNYCMVRAKQQDSSEQNFKFVEKRGLLSLLPDSVRQTVHELIIPLRHFEWGANMNNMQICAMGYGAAITSAASLHAIDRLGNAQYITRIGMALSGGGSSATDIAKTDWLEKEQWQGLRKVVEDSFVVDDWFELFVAQNLVMDGMVHALFFDHLERKINESGGATYSMLTEFIVNWNAESSRWVDKQIAVAAAESDANKEQIDKWYSKWLSEMTAALMPLAESAFDNGADVLADIKQALDQRAKKIGINL